MIIIMESGATKKQVSKVINRVKDIGLDVQVNQGKEQIVLGLLGDTRKVQDIAFRSYEGVETTIRITNTYKLTSRQFHP